MITKNQIKFIKGLHLKKNRIKHKCFIVEGEKNVLELFSSDYEIIQLYATNEWKHDLENINICFIARSVLLRISQLKSPNKVLAIVRIPEKQILNSNKGLTLILDNINDPGNLGAIIRLCDWFSVSQIICSMDTVDIYNNKTIQAAAGSLFRVYVSYVDLKKYLNKINCDIYGATLNGSDVKEFGISTESYLILGNEANGISKDIMKFVNKEITIKGNSQSESLNVASAAAIFLYHFSN